MNARPLFAADSIGKSYGRRRILKSASMWGWPGRITVLLGRNGSGKSTLMRIGAGVLRPDHGVVRVGDTFFESPRLHALARAGVFYVPDRGALPVAGTMREMVKHVQKRFGVDRAQYQANESLGLDQLMDAALFELSGGELKRAELAVAIARHPLCLIADEPFAGISPLDGDRIASAFVTMKQHGCALIISGHEVPQMLAIADEIVWVTSGTTHGIGSPATASTHHQFCTEYLGTKVAVHA